MDTTVKLKNEKEYEAASAYIDDMWGIEEYLDIESQRDLHNLVLAVEEYEDEHYPIGI